MNKLITNLDDRISTLTNSAESTIKALGAQPENGKFEAEQAKIRQEQVDLNGAQLHLQDTIVKFRVADGRLQTQKGELDAFITAGVKCAEGRKLSVTPYVGPARKDPVNFGTNIANLLKATKAPAAVAIAEAITVAKKDYLAMHEDQAAAEKDMTQAECKCLAAMYALGSSVNTTRSALALVGVRVPRESRPRNSVNTKHNSAPMLVPAPAPSMPNIQNVG